MIKKNRTELLILFCIVLKKFIPIPIRVSFLTNISPRLFNLFLYFIQYALFFNLIHRLTRSPPVNRCFATIRSLLCLKIASRRKTANQTKLSGLPNENDDPGQVYNHLVLSVFVIFRIPFQGAFLVL